MPKSPKSRKTHLLLGSISTAWSAKSADPKYKNIPYWTLYIQVENIHGSHLEKVYVLTNLVPPTIPQTLEQQTYQGKKYQLECEKRVRGWRLRNWREILNLSKNFILQFLHHGHQVNSGAYHAMALWAVITYPVQRFFPLCLDGYWFHVHCV